MRSQVGHFKTNLALHQSQEQHAEYKCNMPISNLCSASTNNNERKLESAQAVRRVFFFTRGTGGTVETFSCYEEGHQGGVGGGDGGGGGDGSGSSHGNGMSVSG